MSTAVAETAKTESRPQLPAIRGPRLPFHPLVEERFGIGRAEWKALVEAVFPGAQSLESVILALSYCKARKLDPFKRVVHIVPIWSKEQRCLVDTVWPGIGELRTTAFRTGEYAGRDATVFGDILEQKVGSADMKIPEWAQVTVYRMVRGTRVGFTGPRVYWLETYATVKRDDDTPNEMWLTRPRGQIDKCAEAAALRAAFPEEVGGDYIPEEVQHAGKNANVIEGQAKKTLASLTDEIEGKSAAAETDPELDPGETMDAAGEIHQGPHAEDENQEQPELPDSFGEMLLILEKKTAVGSVNDFEPEAIGQYKGEWGDALVSKFKEACEEKRAAIRNSRGSRSNGGEQ